MELNNAVLGDVPMLVLTGAVDQESCSQLEAALDGLFRARHNIIFVDLCGVAHLDSAGLAVVVAGVKALGGRGWLGMIGPNTGVRDSLESAGLIGHPNVLVFENRHAALMITGQRQST